MQTFPFELATTIAFRAARVVQWLAVGDLETAGRWAAACDGGTELEQIALARLRLAQGRAAEALRLLDRQRPLAEAGGRSGRSIEILALSALALEALGRPGEADAALAQALFLARPEEYARLFLDLGKPLGELLARAAGDYGRDLLDAMRAERQATPVDALVEPITERELEVLQLLAEGLSNKKIADRLVVAPSTVKQHLKNIYGKLDVHSRTQAVARGRELGLF
jgi:LuxR family maltose regulon positive regulatory protein